MAYTHVDGEYFIYNNQGQVISPNHPYISPTQGGQLNAQKSEFQEISSYHAYPSSSPNYPSHHRGWSESTTSTHISSGKPFLPSSSSSIKKSFTLNTGGSWIPEIISVVIAFGAVGSMIGVLAKFNGHALPEWPYYITLNALIAVLAAVTASAMNMSLQNSMSQLKWVRFKKSRTRLSDMEVYDEASRGIWGAMKLLFTYRGSLLGSFGAFVSIIVLLLGPFAQQIVVYQTREAESLEGASVSRALNYTGALPGTSSSTGFVPILPLKSAVYNGLFAENGRPEASLAFDCQSGNCTFDPYDTLGVCAQCVDLTPFIQEYCAAGRASGNCGWQVPQGAELADSTEVFSMTSQIPSARGDQPHSSIVRLIFMGTEAYNGRAGEVNPWARQCTLSACVQTLETTISNGVLDEKTVDIRTNTTVLDNTDLNDGYDHNVYVDGKDGTQYKLSIEAMLAMRGWFSTLFTNGSASRSTSAYNRTITDNSVVVNLTVGISSGETFFDSDIVTAFYWNYYEYANGLDLLVNDTATSMTVAFRSFSGAAPVSGRAVYTESYVQVRWSFAIVPIFVVIGAAIFLLAMIYQSRKSATQVWKSSALAMLFHGLDENAKNHFMHARSLQEQNAQARATKVQLEESDDITLLRM
ncbi:hypothetical protein F5B22DRAFT_649197 [Xylaria bambusicola]|uniref:uncharacterized protein n=1 Tax=Xylaria bambusicola TaxID=326684 RepID=UPI0020073D77|nr:uncharacterized protein F5B22DRAFT_649197 [Xylaria bambusicola]KAI0509150.1 hypothetical protein F5B22DRAFT_649197 [Xylaria bambusicola]